MATIIFNHSNTVLDKLQEQRELEEFCDVILQVEQTNFPAHKTILAACSEYFHKMFTTDMIEKESKLIKIHDVTPEAMAAILTCIYTAKIELNLKNIGDVLHAASLMQLNSISDQISEHIYTELLTPENCCFFRDLADMYSLEKLNTFVYRYFLQNFEEIHKLSSFLQLHFDVVKRVLSSDDLTVKKEFTIFEFIVKWVEVDCERRKVQFPLLLKLVRLQFIPIGCVLDKIQTCDLVKESHQCRDIVDEMMKYHIAPSILNSQTPRHSLVPEPDSIMLLPYKECSQYIYDSNLGNCKKVIFDGLTSSTVLKQSAIATKHPNVVLCGGLDANNQVSGNVVRFDGTRWMSLPSLIEPRCGAAATFLDEVLFVFGGETFPVSTDATFSSGQTNPDASNFAKCIEKFDRVWMTRDDHERSPRSYAAAHTVETRIYLIGGYTLTNPGQNLSRQKCKQVSQQTLIFFPYVNKWKKGGNLHSARASFASAVLKRSQTFYIYVLGGSGFNGSDLSSVECLNTKQNVWENITPFGSGIASTCCFLNENLYYSQSNRLCNFNVTSKQQTSHYDVQKKGYIISFAQKYLTQPYAKVAF